MESGARRLGRNLKWLLASEAGARALGFVYVAGIARLLGLENFGVLSLTLVYVEVFRLLIGFSFQEVYVREVLHNGTSPRPLLRRMFGIQMAASVFALILGFGIGRVYGGELELLVPLATGLALLRSVGQTWLAVPAAHEDFRPRATYSVLERAGAVLALAGLWLFDYGLPGILLALTAGSLCTAAFARVVANRLLGEMESPTASESPNPSLATRALLRSGVEFSGLRWLGLLHSRSDDILVEALAGPETLGIYAAAYRLMEVFKVIPNLAEQTLFPNFLKRLKDVRETRTAVGRVFKYLVALTAPLVAISWALQDEAVRVVYGQPYAGAAPVWFILMGSLVLISVSRPFLVLLRAEGRLAAANAIAVCSLLVNLGLNLLLIPKHGALGAAAATCASQATFFLLASGLRREFGSAALKYMVGLLPSLVVLVGLVMILQRINPWTAAIAATFAYGATLWFAGGFNPAERRQLQSLARG